MRFYVIDPMNCNESKSYRTLVSPGTHEQTQEHACLSCYFVFLFVCLFFSHQHMWQSSAGLDIPGLKFSNQSIRSKL